MMMAPTKFPENGNNIPQSMRWVAYFAETYGVPLVLLVLAAWWFATRVGEPLVNAHVKFLDREQQMTEKVVQMQEQALKNHDLIIQAERQQANCMEKITGFCDKVDTVHTEQLKKLHEIDSKLPSAKTN